MLSTVHVRQSAAEVGKGHGCHNWANFPTDNPFPLGTMDTTSNDDECKDGEQKTFSVQIEAIGSTTTAVKEVDFTSMRTPTRGEVKSALGVVGVTAVLAKFAFALLGI